MQESTCTCVDYVQQKAFVSQLNASFNTSYVAMHFNYYY